MHEATRKPPYLTASEALRAEFGRKIYKLALDIGCTCPTRDGTKGTRGCIFCSQAGSGEFSERFTGKQAELDRAKARLSRKIDIESAGFIAYFQNYTNTYAPAAYLEPLFNAALADPSVVALSVATRPDCLGPEILEMLSRLRRKAPVFVELGLQTIHPATAAFIRRGFDLAEYDEAVRQLRARDIRVITHLIFGLPYGGQTSGPETAGPVLAPDGAGTTHLSLETPEMMMESVKYVAQSGVSGVKFQLLHVMRGTDLAVWYERGAFRTLAMDEYVGLVRRAISLLPPGVAVHRATGDAPRRLLIAPLWSTDKKRVLNGINAPGADFGAKNAKSSGNLPPQSAQ